MTSIREKIKRNRQLYKLLYPIVNAIRYIVQYYIPALFFWIGMFLRKLNILPKDANLVQLKDKYKGKRIFVIATGPSVQIQDLEKMGQNGDITIAVNSICSVFGKTTWRPTCYIMTDYLGVNVLRERYGKICYDDFATDTVVLSRQCKNLLVEDEKGTKEAFIPFSYQDHWLNHFSKHRAYNRDMSVGAYDLFTVSCSAINLADYMGASEIYLYGFDGYNVGAINHVGDTEDVQYDDSGVEYEAIVHTNTKMQRGYEYLRDVAIKDRIPIYNATRGGFLEVFPRVQFDDLFKEN